MAGDLDAGWGAFGVAPQPVCVEPLLRERQFDPANTDPRLLAQGLLRFQGRERWLTKRAEQGA